MRCASETWLIVSFTDWMAGPNCPDAACRSAANAARLAASQLAQAMVCPVNGGMNDITARLDRLERQIAEVRTTLLMVLSVQQVMAIRMGIAPADYQAMSPAPIPTPFDIQDMLKASDQAAGL